MTIRMSDHDDYGAAGALEWLRATHWPNGWAVWNSHWPDRLYHASKPGGNPRVAGATPHELDEAIAEAEASRR